MKRFMIQMQKRRTAKTIRNIMVPEGLSGVPPSSPSTISMPPPSPTSKNRRVLAKIEGVGVLVAPSAQNACKKPQKKKCSDPENAAHRAGGMQDGQQLLPNYRKSAA